MKRAVIRLLTRKFVIIPISLLCLYSLTGFLIAPLVAGWYAPKFANDRMHCRLDIGKIRINPFLLTLDVTDFNLSSEAEPLAGFKRLFLDFEITRLGNRAATFREIRLENPAVHLTIHPDGSLNLDKVIPPATPDNPPPSDSNPLRLWIDNASITGGTVFFTDERPHQPAALNLQDIDVTATDMTTLPDRSGSYSISARTPAGETFDCQGKIALTPLNTDGKLSLNTLRLATLWPFMKDRLDLESVSGNLSLSTDYKLETGNAPLQFQCTHFHTELSDLSLKRPHAEKPFFVLNRLDVDQARFNLSEKQIEIGKIDIAAGALNLITDPDGRMNILQIAREDAGEKSAENAPVEPHGNPASSPWKINADSVQIQDIAFEFDDFSRASPVRIGVSSVGIQFGAKIQAGSPELQVSVSDFSSELKSARIQESGASQPVFQTNRLTVEGGALDLSSRTVTVSSIALHGGSADVRRDAKGEINWQHLFSPRKGEGAPPAAAAPKTSEPPCNFRIQTFQVDDFSSDLWDMKTVPGNPILNIRKVSCRLSDVDGKSPMGFEMGFSLKQGGNVLIHGKLNPETSDVDADLDLKTLSLTPLQPYIQPVAAVVLKSADASFSGKCHYGTTAAGPKIVYTGSADLNHLLIVEPGISKPLIGWKSLEIPHLKLTTQPDNLNIDKIRLVHPIGEVIIAEDHTLNLTKILKNRGSRKKSGTARKPISHKQEKPFPVRIGKVEIENGNMIFADLSLRPQFMTKIHDLKGWVSGLTSTGDASSQIQLNGIVDQYGMAKIIGKINLFNPGKSTDMSVIFKNVEMTSLTPYSGKFAGRRITSGKLSADLKYRIQDDKLLGDNQIIVDNLTLGQHVDSPDAVNLPLDLAVALLKDSSGRIDLGLPVSGDLNDPQFSYGQLIWKALTNLLTKIVTSPFRALGALFGSGDESQVTIAFDPGSSELLPPEKEKLQKLADTLKNRPQLKLGVTGHYNPDTDGAAIKKQTLNLTIAERSGASMKGKEDAAAVDFTAPKVQETLSKMFMEKAGQSAFEGVKQSIEKNTPNKAGIPQALAETLYNNLLDAEPVPPADKLAALAHDRADNIARELETVDGIPAIRLEIKPPDAKKSDPPSADFSLEAMAG